MSDTPDNVVVFPGPTTLDIPVERVLSAAQEAGLAGVLVIGALPSGALYVAASSGSPAEAVWDMERAKHWLFAQCCDDPA